jgi:glutaredoxin-like protein
MFGLDEKIKEEVKNIFKDLKDPIKLIVFTRDDTITVPGRECPTCKDNETLIKEVSALSDKISIEVYDIAKDDDKVKDFSIHRIPVTLVQTDKNVGIRLYGVPAGHEFATLLNAINIVSKSSSELSEQTIEKLKTISKPVHIQVFVTLSCPYCAPAASMAHNMAVENDNIKADMINAQEFPELAQKYDVFSVPKIVINETVQFEGAVDENAFLDKVLESVNPSKKM